MFIGRWRRSRTKAARQFKMVEVHTNAMAHITTTIDVSVNWDGGTKMRVKFMVSTVILDTRLLDK